MKFIVIFLSVILLISCANTKKIMNSWKGKNLDELFTAWGYPDEEKEIAGKTLYYWHDENVMTMPASSQTFSNFNNNQIFTKTYVDSGGTYPRKCSRIIEADENNIIVGWTLRGNACNGYVPVGSGTEE